MRSENCSGFPIPRSARDCGREGWPPKLRSAGLPIPLPQLGASGPARTGCLPLTRWPLYLVSYEGIVSSVRFERTLPSPSCWCLLPIGLRGHRSRRPVPIRTARLTRAGPQPCAAARLPGLDSNQRGKGQGLAGDIRRPTRNRYGRRDSNSHTAGFEPTRYPSSRHARKVRREGNDPPQPGVRARCSAD